MMNANTKILQSVIHSSIVSSIYASKHSFIQGAAASQNQAPNAVVSQYGAYIYTIYVCVNECMLEGHIIFNKHSMVIK